MKNPRSPTTRRARRALRAILATASVAFLLSWNLPTKVEASAGELDAAFGIGGKVVTDFGRNELAVAVAMQPDLKIVVAGTAESKKKGNNFAVARYNPDGTLDPTFGSEGSTDVDFFRRYNAAYAVAIQDDGRIVLAGEVSDDLHSSFGLARLNADGSLDASFGSEGLVKAELSDMSAGALSITLQPDGKILAAGDAFSSTSGTGVDFALVRFNSDGSLDESFGTDGKVVTDFFNNRGIKGRQLRRISGCHGCLGSWRQVGQL